MQVFRLSQTAFFQADQIARRIIDTGGPNPPAPPPPGP
jgi:hypothetical protein